MAASVSTGRIFDCIHVREPAFAARGAAPRVDDATGEWRTPHSLGMVVCRIGQMLERRRQAEFARRDLPLSLDDAWAGGWYARSRILREAVLQRECSTSAKPAPLRQNWDDRLD